MKSIISIVFVFALIACAGCPVKSDSDAPAAPVQKPAATTQAVQVSTAMHGVSVAPDGTVHAGPGQSVVIEQRDVVDDASNTLSRSDKAAAKGTDVSAIGQEVKTSTENQPSKVSLGDTTGGGIDGGESAGEAGGSKTEMKIIGVPPKQAGLYIFGGLLVAVGIGLCFYERFKLGGASIVAGIGLITCGVMIDSAPWVFIVAGLIGIAWLAYLFLCTAGAAKQSDSQQTTLESVVPAIHDLGSVFPDAAAWLKKRIDHHTDSTDETAVKGVVDGIKSDLNLTPPPAASTVSPAPAGATP